MAVYETAGSAHMFCSQAWHRSGTALRRTIKVAYFFDVDVIDLDEDAKVKPEIQTETAQLLVKGPSNDLVQSSHGASSSDAEVPAPEKEGEDTDADEPCQPSNFTTA